LVDTIQNSYSELASFWGVLGYRFMISSAFAF